MKRTISTHISTVVVVMFLIIMAAAQTRHQLEGKYQRVNAYLVRPNILLTARYSRDGRVCKMELQPLRSTDDKVLLSPLSEEETVHAVEAIVPENERGKKLGLDKSPRLAGTSTFSTRYIYENITIRFAGTTAGGDADLVATVVWHNRSCK